MPRLHAPAALLAAAALAAPVASAAPPPTLARKQAQARAVLAQVDALDIRFGRVVDAWDGARIRLAAATKALAANEVALRRSTRRTRAADARLAQRLVAIYEGGEPSLVEVLVGASTLSDLIDRYEAASTISAYDRRLADEARAARAALVRARARLQATRERRRATVQALGGERRRIAGMLGRRQRLLASVQGEVARLRRQEAARQEVLAAAARARVARAQALAAKQAAARARARAAPPPSATTTAAAPVAQPPAATTAAPPPATTSPPAVSTPVPAPALGPGHPDAAAVALRYLGVPYRWGGASPTTGFDCSGLVMFVYARLGIALPHQAAAQYGLGTPVPRGLLAPGDLVFFDGLSHVGIYIGNGEMVHAPQTGELVSVTPLSQFGGARYVGARRLP